MDRCHSSCMATTTNTTNDDTTTRGECPYCGCDDARFDADEGSFVSCSCTRQLTKTQQKAVAAIQAAPSYGDAGNKVVQLGNLRPCHGVGVRRPTWNAIKHRFVIVSGLGDSVLLVRAKEGR